MANTSKAELFEKTPIPKAVMTLGIPTVISSLVMVIYSLADTYFVGMVNDPIQSAAVTLASPLLLAFNAINNLFGVGSSSMMSRALGRQDYDTVHKSSAFGFYCALFCGILYSILVTLFKAPLMTVLGAGETTVDATLEYMKWTIMLGAAPSILNVVLAYLVRSEGSSLHASIGTMSGCILNMILDPIFILPQGLNMGAAGAGLATFISNCVACAYFIIFVIAKGKKTYVCLDPRKLSFKKNIVSGVCSVGIPAAIQNLLNVTSLTILNNFTAAYGSDPVAAMGISYKVYMVPMQMALGISQGVMPLISYNYASGNIKRMKNAILFALKVTAIFIGVVVVLYYIGASSIIGMFMKNDSIIYHGSRFLRGMCLGLPFLTVDFLCVGVFQACGMGSKSLVFAIMRKVVLEIPALYILNKLFSLYGLGYAQAIAELILSIIALAVLKRMIAKLEKNQIAV